MCYLLSMANTYENSLKRHRPSLPIISITHHQDNLAPLLSLKEPQLPASPGRKRRRINSKRCAGALNQPSINSDGDSSTSRTQTQIMSTFNSKNKNNLPLLSFAIPCMSKRAKEQGGKHNACYQSAAQPVNILPQQQPQRVFRYSSKGRRVNGEWIQGSGE